MDIEVKRTAEALDQGGRAGLGRLTGKTGLLDQICSDATIDDAEHPAHDCRAARKPETHRVRDAQHPLAHRLLGKHLIHQHRALDHAPGTTARTETSPFAVERDQMLGMATLATHPQEAVLKATALQVILEFLFDIPRQRRILQLKVLLEHRLVFVNDLVKEGALRTVVHLQRLANTRLGFPASQRRQHDRILAKPLRVPDYQPMARPCSVVRIVIPTAAKTEATHLLVPQASNSLIPVGIPDPLLHNRLNSFAITRTTP